MLKLWIKWPEWGKLNAVERRIKHTKLAREHEVPSHPLFPCPLYLGADFTYCAGVVIVSRRRRRFASFRPLGWCR
jgi:hypothetical protein